MMGNKEGRKVLSTFLDRVKSQDSDTHSMQKWNKTARKTGELQNQNQNQKMWGTRARGIRTSSLMELGSELQDFVII